MGFGMLGPLARFAAESGFTPVSFAVWRSISSVVALIVLMAVGIAVGRLPTTRLSAISRMEWLQLAAMGLFVAGTTLAMFFAFERITIALALIVFYTFPVIVALAAVPLFGENLGFPKLAALGLSTGGLILLLLNPGTDQGNGGLDVAGVLFAFGASLCQVGFALVAARGFASVPALQSATMFRSFSLAFYALVLIPLVVLLGEGASLVEPFDSTADLALILVAGIFGAALPAVLLIAGYRRVGPTRGAVLMLVEPVTGVLLATLLLAEQPTATQLVGGLLVLTGAVLVQLAPVSRPQAESQPAAE
jgi:DME family drug/metabolite transporter